MKFIKNDFFYNQVDQESHPSRCFSFSFLSTKEKEKEMGQSTL